MVLWACGGGSKTKTDPRKPLSDLLDDEGVLAEILTEINAVKNTNRWNDGYDWYTKGRLLLEVTDKTEFTETQMKSIIKKRTKIKKFRQYK